MIKEKTEKLRMRYATVKKEKTHSSVPIVNTVSQELSSCWLSEAKVTDFRSVSVS